MPALTVFSVCGRMDCNLADKSSLINRLLNSSIAPIGIQVCVPGFPDSNNTMHDASYFQALCSEIDYKSHNWSPRGSVRRLHWSGNIFSRLGKPDFTFVVHALSKRFKFDNEANLVCSVDLYLEYLNQENLALLRGLGFTSINLIINTSQVDASYLAESNNMFDAITAMDFQNVQVTINCNDSGDCDNIARNIIDFAKRLSPNSLEIRAKPGEQNSIDRLPCSEAVFKYLVGNMQRIGYAPLPKVAHSFGFIKLTASFSKLQSKWDDWKPKRASAFLSLGCAGVSRIGNLFLTNTPDVDLYEEEGKQGIFKTDIEMIPDEVRYSEWLAAHFLEQGVISNEQLGSVDSGALPRVKRICEEWANRGVLTRATTGYNCNSDQIKQRETLARMIISAGYPSFGEHSYLLFT